MFVYDGAQPGTPRSVHNHPPANASRTSSLRLSPTPSSRTLDDFTFAKPALPSRSMQMATNDLQGPDEAQTRPVAEPAFTAYETTSFGNAPPSTTLPEPVGTGRYQPMHAPSSPPPASPRRLSAGPSQKRVNNCGGSPRFDLYCLLTAMVASGLCAVAVYVLFASAQQCLPTLAMDSGNVAPPLNHARRRRSLTRDDCICSCSFDPRDKGWLISLETSKPLPTCDVENYTISVNGKKVANPDQLELEFARDLLDLLSAVLLKDEENAHHDNGSAGNSEPMTSTTALQTTSRAPTTTFAPAVGEQDEIVVDEQKEIDDLFVNPEVAILEPLGEIDIGSGDDFWGSVPAVEYTLPIDENEEF
ncbi:Oidioi.mRNA.OKI2018_I69.PAR.g13024.t1.cds [Oikopleura dioica]|uniref:Oidioi.mRNA.OKI2018_I69.PAR.g13024.t1.cds n=1 Tax=Oikopleura dioica TaxID=34765 RepID=A0ABN7S2V7_OIKDI|nr:Oidioi.mRNA.OKI2018_I69.PAR.g13024.t1.cds [Oikopleura dioica]